MGKRKKISRQALARFRERGHQAFLQGAYTKAIEEWQKVREAKASMLPVETLAEAYFRRGVTRFYEKRATEEALEDLLHAIELAPKAGRYEYHLGLLYHHLGDLPHAVQCYEAALKKAPALEARLAYPLALALSQLGRDPQQHEIWPHLSPEERAMFQEVSVFSRRPYAVSENAPDLWKGMAALDEDDEARAEAYLKRSLEEASTQIEQGLAHYYLGVLAARREEMKAARHHWIEATAAGLEGETLSLNLGESFHRLAEARLENDDPEGALHAAQEALRYKPERRSLLLLLSHIHQRLGYQAARQGNWTAAEKHWEEAYELEEGNFRLAFNLALCYERQENYIDAGETWREVLRRRPRRDDDPDALDDEQVALIWKRAAEAYVKTGEYDEAIYVYRQAVKYNPEHLPTRMALVEGLLANGQLEAAENELKRILEKAPDHVPALVQMGDIVASSDQWWSDYSPTHYWKRALELDPNNLEAQEALIDYYIDEANRQAYWGNIKAAIHLYEEALEVMPHHGTTLSYLGQAYIALKQPEKARTYFEEALKHEGTPDIYLYILRICASYHEDGWFWEYLERAGKELNVSLPFYIDVLEECLDLSREELVEPLVEHLSEVVDPQEAPFVTVGEVLAFSSLPDPAETYLRRALEAGEDPARAHAALGIVVARRGDRRKARDHLYQAEHFARRQGDEDLQQIMREMRETITAMPLDFLDGLLREMKESGRIF